MAALRHSGGSRHVASGWLHGIVPHLLSPTQNCSLWRARIWDTDREVYLGHFEDAAQAGRAYDHASIKCAPLPPHAVFWRVVALTARLQAAGEQICSVSDRRRRSTTKVPVRTQRQLAQGSTGGAEFAAQMAHAWTASTFL